jgi:hypothetical protein
MADGYSKASEAAGQRKRLDAGPARAPCCRTTREPCEPGHRCLCARVGVTTRIAPYPATLSRFYNSFRPILAQPPSARGRLRHAMIVAVSAVKTLLSHHSCPRQGEPRRPRF